MCSTINIQTVFVKRCFQSGQNDVAVNEDLISFLKYDKLKVYCLFKVFFQFLLYGDVFTSQQNLYKNIPI